MPKIVFTETRVVQDEHVGTARETRYQAGFAYELSEGSAQRWINRGVAVLADAAPNAPAGAVPAPAPVEVVQDGDRIVVVPDTPAPAEDPAPKRRRSREKLE